MGSILILGAAVWSDGPSPTLRRRTLHAAAVWHADQSSWVIPCGGLGTHAPTEAAAMRDLLVENGVAKARILQEGHSTSTLENIRYALPFLRLLDAGPVTIVTDGYHAKRALLVARHFGLDATASCPTLSTTGFLDATRRHSRESLARLSYRARLRKTPRAF